MPAPTSWLYFYIDSRSAGDERLRQHPAGRRRSSSSPRVRFDLGRHLRLQLDHTYQRLDVDEGELFTADLSELRVTYQFNVRTFLRLITQYQRPRAPGRSLHLRGRRRDSEQLFNQLLFSYKLNPQTVLFLGYSDNHCGDPAVDLAQANRTLFFKIGYAAIF